MFQQHNLSESVAWKPISLLEAGQTRSAAVVASEIRTVPFPEHGIDFWKLNMLAEEQDKDVRIMVLILAVLWFMFLKQWITVLPQKVGTKAYQMGT